MTKPEVRTFSPGDRVMWHRRSDDLSGRVTVIAAEVIEVSEPNPNVNWDVARVAVRHTGGVDIVYAADLEPRLAMLNQA